MQASPLPPHSSDGAKTSIWLVEDDELVGRLMLESLQKDGYAVQWFVTGEAALEGTSSGPPAQVLVTDISLPGLSGLEVARRLTHSWPSLTVLVTSGYPHDVQAREGALPEHYEYLPKPFTPRVLLDRVRGMRIERSA